MEIGTTNTLFQKAKLAPRRMVVILGVPIDALTMDETLDRIDIFVQIGRQTGRTYQVATVNTDFIVNAIKDPEVRYILQESDLATADGMPVVKGANILGVALEDRVTGVDMIPLLAERAAKKGYSIYFLGAAPGIAAQAAAILKQQNPDLVIAGVCSPPFTPILEMDNSVIDQIKAAAPDILLVAFGNPKQEKWIAMHRYDLNIPVMIGVGGTLDFITGTSVRAPRWLQKIGLEWLHRLVKDPRRLWKRYVVDFFVFGSFLAQQLWLMKRFGSPPISLPVSEELLINNVGILRVRGTLSIANLELFSQKVDNIITQSNRLVIDLTKADFIDSAAVGTLVHLTKELRVQGGELYLVSLPQKILKTLELLHLDQYFNIQGRLEDILYEGKTIRASIQKDAAGDQHGIVRIGGETWQVIRIPHRFDATNASQVHQECNSVLEKSSHLLLDFSDTVMLASAGLAVLADLHRKTQSTKCQMRLKGVGKEALQVLQLVKFDQFLHIE